MTDIPPVFSSTQYAAPAARRQPMTLTFTRLDDRIVPAAAILDLTSAGASSSAAGAIVRQVDADFLDTDNMDTFVRIQRPGSGGSEQGYNTDARPLQFDEKNSAQFTHSLTLGSVPLIEQNNVLYREFVLDINQKASA